jgi:hypothetical protein
VADGYDWEYVAYCLYAFFGSTPGIMGSADIPYRPLSSPADTWAIFRRREADSIGSFYRIARLGLTACATASALWFLQRQLCRPCRRSSGGSVLI